MVKRKDSRSIKQGISVRTEPKKIRGSSGDVKGEEVRKWRRRIARGWRWEMGDSIREPLGGGFGGAIRRGRSALV